MQLSNNMLLHQISVSVRNNESIFLRDLESQSTTVMFENFWYLPDCGSVAEESNHALRLMAGQELIKVSVLHVLCDHTQRVRAHTHRQQPDDVGVFQSWHDLYLLQEIIL